MRTKMSGVLFTLFYTGILLLSGGCSTADMRKGAVALELGDYPLAMSFFSDVLRHDPGHFGARLGMGKALLQKAVDRKDDTTAWRQAIMHLQAAGTIHGDADIPVLLSQVWSERASQLLLHCDTLGAIAALEEAISAYPTTSGPINLAGILYFKTGMFRKARDYFKRSAALDSMNASPWFNLGMLNWEQRQVRAAYDFWRKAHQLAVNDEKILHWLAISEKALQRTASESGGE